MNHILKSALTVALAMVATYVLIGAGAAVAAGVIATAAIAAETLRRRMSA